jgi:hypothetical protein
VATTASSNASQLPVESGFLHDGRNTLKIGFRKYCRGIRGNSRGMQDPFLLAYISNSRLWSPKETGNPRLCESKIHRMGQNTWRECTRYREACATPARICPKAGTANADAASSECRQRKIEEPVLPRTPNNHIGIEAAMAANLSRLRAQRMIWLALQSNFVWIFC